MPARQIKAVWKPLAVILGQLLLTGLLLCVFALFHHVLPSLQSAPAKELPRFSPPPTAAERLDEYFYLTPSAETPLGEADEAPGEAPSDAAAESWRERFAEHFSDSVVAGEDFYRSPSLSVELSAFEHSDDYPELSYYVADVYLADLSCLSSVSPSNATYAGSETLSDECGAVLAVNGDSFKPHYDGVCVRNGSVMKESASPWDICVLRRDGSLSTYGPEGYDTQALLAEDPYEIWNFGPALLDENGQPLESFNANHLITGLHPRTAIGCLEPGHYCFVVVDGRSRAHSAGADLATLAQIMSDLGCKSAYNLDGGDSSQMVFRGETVNHPRHQRPVSDLLAVRDEEAAP